VIATWVLTAYATQVNLKVVFAAPISHYGEITGVATCGAGANFSFRKELQLSMGHDVAYVS